MTLNKLITPKTAALSSSSLGFFERDCKIIIRVNLLLFFVAGIMRRVRISPIA
jgi:hypothetical protein